MSESQSRYLYTYPDGLTDEQKRELCIAVQNARSQGYDGVRIRFKGQNMKLHPYREGETVSL